LTGACCGLSRNLVSPAAAASCRLANGSHVELPCNEVTHEQTRRDIASLFSKAAEAWWNSMVAEPHSLTKPVYLLRLGGAAAAENHPSNVEASGIAQMRRGSMALDSVVNYTAVGDYGCWKIRVSLLLLVLFIIIMLPVKP
jgi:cellulase/cellobiase CelA1